MRDPLSWSLPLGRLFGVTVRIHILFVIVIIGLVGRAAFVGPGPNEPPVPGLWVEALFLMVLLFFSVLLHEFGHCFGARAVDGDAHEILLWPLGGLASVEVPQTPRATFLSTAAGPAVNLGLCLVACALLAPMAMLPSFNPLDNPYVPHLYNWSEGAWVGSKESRGDLFKFSAYKRGEEWVSANPKPADAEGLELKSVEPWQVKKLENNAWVLKTDSSVAVVAEQLPFGVSFWQVQLARLFWVNWILLLINLVPAFPLDGGRMMQSLLWWRSDYRTGTLAAVIVGFFMMLVCVLLSIVTVEPLALILAVFIFLACRRQWILLETGGEESVFGYDFSQGYTSLEKEAPPGAKKRPNFIQRWLQARAAKKAQREQEQREADEKRMDELLQKVQGQGLQALTDEERRFLQRVSARYRNRQ
jgi:Zn-dependent protease